MKRSSPFDYFPEKSSDWQSVLQCYDAIYAWLGYWRDKMPEGAVKELQDILGPYEQECEDCGGSGSYATGETDKPIEVQCESCYGTGIQPKECPSCSAPTNGGICASCAGVVGV